MINFNLHDLIWKARKTNNKYLWLVVGVVTIFQLIWKSSMIGLVLGTMYFGFYWATSIRVIAQFVIVFILISPIIEATVDIKTVIRNISNMISIAGDMNRIRKGNYGVVWRIVSIPMFILFGFLATYSAFVVWMLKRKSPSTLEVSELDVLGTALARSGFCCDAGIIFAEIERVYNQTVWRSDDIAVSNAVSYALACKWMMSCWSNKKEYLGEKIQIVMRNHPNLPDEVTIRLNEALDQ